MAGVRGGSLPALTASGARLQEPEASLPRCLVALLGNVWVWGLSLALVATRGHGRLLDGARPQKPLCRERGFAPACPGGLDVDGWLGWAAPGGDVRGTGVLSSCLCVVHPPFSPQLTNKPGKTGPPSSKCSMRSGCARPRRQMPMASPGPRCWSAARRAPCPPLPGGPVSPRASGHQPPPHQRARVTHWVPALARSQHSPGGSLWAGKWCGDASCPELPGFRAVFLTFLNFFFLPIQQCPAPAWMEGGSSSSPQPLSPLSLQDTGATSCPFGEAAAAIQVTRSTQLPWPQGDGPGTHSFPAGPWHTGQHGGPQGAAWEHPRENPCGTGTGQIHSTHHPADTSTPKKHPARRQIICGSCQAAGGGDPCRSDTLCPQPHQGLCHPSTPGCPERLTELEKPAGREPGSSQLRSNTLTPKFLQPASKTGRQC